ncbi:MAG: hypothetical protein OXC63_15115 [Aestuariivita sp.]|nr:hypothetical protein [Aestuariivita sp.]MCY4346738.1 hypothetical protein [Aestuariivita sp.]
MPPHDGYIECFLGGGAILKRKPAAMRSIGLDLDARAIPTFTCDYPHARLKMEFARER